MLVVTTDNPFKALEVVLTIVDKKIVWPSEPVYIKPTPLTQEKTK